MKKLLICLIILSISTTFLYAQTKKQKLLPQEQISYLTNSTPKLAKTTVNAILFESFEGSFPPDNWNIISDGSSDIEWVQTNRRAHSGSYSALVSYCADTETQDEWLITSRIDLSQAPSAKLVFFEDESYWAGYGDHHYVKISTSSQNDQSSFVTLLEMTPATHAIAGFAGAPVEINLSNYLGEDSVYIAFQYVGSNADNWYIDDIGVYEPDEHDVTTIDIALDDHYDPNSLIKPTATVKNVGLNAESFSVTFGYFEWDGTPKKINARNVENLAVGETAEVEFSFYIFKKDIQYNFFVKTNLETDLDASNDTYTKVINTFTTTKPMVFVEKATGTWCGYCPGSALSVDHLVEYYPDNLAVLEYHGGDSYENQTGRDRINFYGITGYPTAYFNGTASLAGGSGVSGWIGVYNIYHELYLAAIEELTAFAIDLQVIDNGGGNLTAYSNTTYNAVSLLPNHRLFYGLCESHIYKKWGGLDSLQFVARGIFPNSNGKILYDEAEPPTKGMVITDTTEIKVPSNTEQHNCELIVFLQEMDSKEIVTVTKVQLDSSIGGSSVNNITNSTIPEEFILEQNYPNPFNPVTSIQFNMPEAGEVDIAVYNINGQRINTIASGQYEAGNHKIQWNGKNYSGQETASGIYYVKANYKDVNKTIKLVKLK